jgi:hypothetical protein
MILIVIAIIKIISNEESIIAEFLTKIPKIKNIPKISSIKGRTIVIGLIRNSGSIL